MYTISSYCINNLETTNQSLSYIKNVTLYQDLSVPAKACILYFHGGGLLYGSRTDLPELHLKSFTENGYPVLAFDYPLAPAAKLDQILSDILDSILFYQNHGNQWFGCTLPYILFGRSSGAYLSLLAASRISNNSDMSFSYPIGILSYYGYGFLCDNWYETANTFYRSFPKIEPFCIDALSETIHCVGPLATHFSKYVYARQSGKWKELIYSGREKFFLLDYSLRLVDTLPCPLFCAHSIADPDVPFSEFQVLSQKYHAKTFIASGQIHDFDRDSHSLQTNDLLIETLNFLSQLTS